MLKTNRPGTIVVLVSGAAQTQAPRNCIRVPNLLMLHLLNKSQMVFPLKPHLLQDLDFKT